MNTEDISEIKEGQKPLRVAFYLRVSSDEQVEKFGLEMQREALEGLLKSKGSFENGTPKYVLAGKKYIYIEEGISGTIPQYDRPAFSQLIQDIEFSSKEDRPFDVIAVYKIDRLARRLNILLDTISFFKKNNIELVSANESIDTNTPFGRAILGIIGVIAELELETIRERTQGGRKEGYKKGVVMGSSAEYGYEKDVEGRRVILKPEAEVVKQIFYEFVYKNKSPEAIRQELTDKKVLSPDSSALKHEKNKGKSKKKNPVDFWSDMTVRSILKNKVYLGLYYYGKTKNLKNIPEEKWQLSPYRHEAIVDEQTFEMAQKRLNKRSKHQDSEQRRVSDHVYILSSLLKCDYCKSFHTGGHYHWIGSRKKLKTNKYSYTYACGRKSTKKFDPVCTTLPIPAEQLEDYIVSFIKSLISNPNHIYEYQSKLHSTKLTIKHIENKMQTLRNFINSAPNRIENLKSQHQAGIIPSIDELQTQIREINSQKDKFQNELKELQINLTSNEIQRNYVRTLKQFASEYADLLEDIFKDRSKTQNIVQALVKEIIIYSRPVKEEDVIAGVKKQEKGVLPRAIPESIQIVLNLPVDLMIRLATDFNKDNPNKEEFLAGKSNL